MNQLPEKPVTLADVLGIFFNGRSGKYLVLGDKSHGVDSLESIMNFVTAQSADLSAKIKKVHIVVEEKEGKVTKSGEKAIESLRKKGFQITYGENDETAPPLMLENFGTSSEERDNWMVNKRVPLFNEHCAEVAKSITGNQNDVLVVICCGTAHVGFCRRKDHSAQEDGLVKRLGAEAKGYALVDVYKSGAKYKPEPSDLVWDYAELDILKPIRNDDDNVTSSDDEDD